MVPEQGATEETAPAGLLCASDVCNCEGLPGPCKYSKIPLAFAMGAATQTCLSENDADFNAYRQDAAHAETN